MMWGVGEDDTKGKHDPHTTYIHIFLYKSIQCIDRIPNHSKSASCVYKYLYDVVSFD